MDWRDTVQTPALPGTCTFQDPPLPLHGNEKINKPSETTFKPTWREVQLIRKQRIRRHLDILYAVPVRSGNILFNAHRQVEPRPLNTPTLAAHLEEDGSLSSVLE